MVSGVSKQFFFTAFLQKACNTFIKKLIPEGIYIMLKVVSDLVKCGLYYKFEEKNLIPSTIAD